MSGDSNNNHDSHSRAVEEDQLLVSIYNGTILYHVIMALVNLWVSVIMLFS